MRCAINNADFWLQLTKELFNIGRFVSTLNSLQFLPRAINAIPRPFAPRSLQFAFFAPPSRTTTTNRSSSFSHMSGSRRARPGRIASNAKVKQEEGGDEDSTSVPQETVEKLQSYAFRSTGKRKDYKSEGTSEGKCYYSSTSSRRLFHFEGTSITRNRAPSEPLGRRKSIANRQYRRVETFKEA